MLKVRYIKDSGEILSRGKLIPGEIYEAKESNVIIIGGKPSYEIVTEGKKNYYSPKDFKIIKK